MFYSEQFGQRETRTTFHAY